MSFSPADLRLRRRRLLRLMRMLFTAQLACTVGLYALLQRGQPAPLRDPLLLTGVAVALLLLPRAPFRTLHLLNGLYLPLVLGLDIVHITLLLWSIPQAELARGSLWALASIPLLMVAGRWWGYGGALPLLGALLLADALVLFMRLPLFHALPVFIFQGVVATLGAVVTGMAEMRLRREQALREALSLSEERVALANQQHQELALQLEQLQQQLQQLSRFAELAGAAGAAVQAARSSVVELQRAVQLMLRDVQPMPLAVRTLPEALARETEALSRELGIDCRFRYVGNLPELRPAVAEYLFRTTQEAFAAVRTYGLTHALTVELEYDHENVLLRITDHGVGGEPVVGSTELEGDQLLYALAGRATELGGSLQVERQAGGARRLEVRLPAPRW